MNNRRGAMAEMEFYTYEDELWCMYADGRNEHITEDSTDVIQEILSIVQEQYVPETYAALEECFAKSAKNPKYYQYLMARRFCKCNFGLLDSTKKDIKNHTMNFEKVPCPLRGECRYEGIICLPKFNSKLSSAELRVMKLVYEGKSNEEIAEELYLSPHTIKNHIKSSYAKLGIHEKSEFIRYADSHNLFE